MFILYSNKFVVLLEIVFLIVAAAFVMLRDAFLFMFGAVHIFFRIKAELVSLNSYSLQYTESVRLKYRNLWCRYRRMGDEFSIMTGYGILMSQFLLCACLWVVINGRRLLPPYLLLMPASLFITLLEITLMSLKTISSCRVFSENLITNHVNGFHVYGTKGGTCGYLRRLWRCQFPLRVLCGKQFVIDRDAIMNFLNALSSNATNVVVLLKIWDRLRFFQAKRKRRTGSLFLVLCTVGIVCGYIVIIIVLEVKLILVKSYTLVIIIYVLYLYLDDIILWHKHFPC